MIGAGTQLGTYEISREIGRGGMGVVYLARDTTLDRNVAIKALPEHLADDPDRLGRFEREAKSLGQLNHPNVAQIFGVEEHEGRKYLVLEYVDGETLEERLDAGPLPVEEALEVCAEIAAGVGAAHDAGVVHRDLKPGNIKFTAGGQVKVLDFGLAKSGDGQSSTAVSGDSPTLSVPSPARPTQPGAILGTAPYMSPEQARGRAVDKRTDIWSFGVVMYESLTGVCPFTGETMTDSLGAILHRELDWNLLPSDTPATVRLLLRRCMQRDRKRRLQDINDARVEIEEAIEDPSGADSIAQQAPRSPSRRRAWGVAVLGAFALGLGSAWIALRVLPDASVAPERRTARFAIELPAGHQLHSGSRVTVAPDGSCVSMILVDEQGDRVLAVREFASPEVRLFPGLDSPYSPFFSPDGRRIAFGNARGELRHVPVGGGPARTIRTVHDGDWGAPAWTEGGTIVSSYGDGSTLIGIDIETGVNRTIATSNELLRGFESAALIPGHPDAVLITGWAGSTIEDNLIAHVDLASGEMTPIVRHAGLGGVTDDGLLVFVRGNSIMSVQLDPSRMRAIGEERVVHEGVITTPWGGGGRFGIGADGTIAYVPGQRIGTGRTLAWHAPDGTREVVFENEPILNISGCCPVTGDLLYETLERGEELWCYEAGTGIKSRVYAEEIWDATWSPDGERIALLLRVGDGTRVVVIGRDGTNEQRIAGPDAQLFVTCWSGDGEALFAHQWTGAGAEASRIVRIPIDDPEQMTPVIASTAWEPSASPDGRFLSYRSNRAGETEVWVRSLDNGREWRVAPGGGRHQVWAPDGSAIYYYNDEMIYRVRLVEDEGGVRFSEAEPYLDSPVTRFSGQFAVDASGRVANVERAPWENEERRIHVATSFVRGGGDE